MDFTELAALAGAHAEARALQVALKLGMFEALAERELDAAGLAAALGCERRATMLLANAMVALGVLELRGAGYALSPDARRFLVRSSEEFLGGMILFDEALFPLWARLEESIRTGAPARASDMFQHRPEETARFIRAMDSLVRARGDARWMAANLDLGAASFLVDVGGGPGTYLLELLRRWPRLRGAICDLEPTLAVARRLLSERDPSALERIELVSFDYHRDELPPRCDAVLLSNVIHSESEATNRALMGKCFRALNPGGRVLVKDHIMNRELTAPAAGAVFSLYLLLTTHGRDYSFEEVAQWMGEAGFIETSRLDLPAPPFTSSLVMARKP